MKTTCIGFRETGKFSRLFCDYVDNHPDLQPFYGLPPTLANYQAQIGQKQASYPAASRPILQQALQRQYAHLANPPAANLDKLLQTNTFTLTTGHQLNIFTGPLYFHYKIMTVINAARCLGQAYPDYHFVPVYWMASEDHDADEISEFTLFGQPYRWQPQQTGAVGRFSPHSLAQVMAQTPEMDGLFQRAYTQCATLAQATRLIVNELYGHHGLVVVDGDDADLKRLFAPTLRDELLHQPSYPAMQRATAGLQTLGYPAQVNPREINLFYLREHTRERIVADPDNQAYQVLNSPWKFTQAELLAELAAHPERFSPNVVLRPVYQETILPNLSYTGGPGEFAYWLQLKPVFAHFNLPYPILLPRNFGLVINPIQQARMQKLGLEVPALFQGMEKPKQKLIDQHAQGNLGTEAEAELLGQVFAQLGQRATQADPTLTKLVAAEQQRALQSLGKVGKRIRRAYERQAETELRQLQSLWGQLFPGGGLQERTENYLTFALNDPDFLPQVAAAFDPFDLRFYVLQTE
ncbi:MAG: bacillithiol biosynthesis cysteine-adding enzyme BshC [Bernardetiaceae bacterium]|jgi:bacillithiol biosynthesis cysteine-adding enzyme BshC|nr:bacillithiol biosynthesis cysteine-adding enzyme BshC [Bernardetiaceae bacterium]